MRNGVIDSIEMSGIAKGLDKIVSLRKKYEFQGSVIPVNSKISIDFSSKVLPVCWICLNNNRVIVYDYGVTSIPKDIAAGLTLGILKSRIKFVTTDKTIANHAFIKDTSAVLRNNLDAIENYLKRKSKERWGI